MFVCNSLGPPGWSCPPQSSNNMLSLWYLCTLGKNSFDLFICYFFPHLLGNHHVLGLWQGERIGTVFALLEVPNQWEVQRYAEAITECVTMPRWGAQRSLGWGLMVGDQTGLPRSDEVWGKDLVCSPAKFFNSKSCILSCCSKFRSVATHSRCSNLLLD